MKVVRNFKEEKMDKERKEDKGGSECASQKAWFHKQIIVVVDIDINTNIKFKTKTNGIIES